MTKEDIMEETWKKTGYIPDTFSQADTAALMNDPVVRLLVSATTHQTSLIADEIRKASDQLLERYLYECIPQGALAPTPAVAIMQIAKKTAKAASNDEESILDENVHIRIGTEKQADKRPVFIPILKTKVVDADISSVCQLEDNKWRIEISTREELQSLSNVSLYFQSLTGCESVRLLYSDFEIPHYRLSDFGSLPFIEPLSAAGNAEYAQFQYYLIQSIYDSLATTPGLYIYIPDTPYSRKPQQRDGRLVLDFEIIADSQACTLTTDSVKLNCVPVANINVSHIQLSKNKNIAKVNLDTHERFISVVPTEDTRHVAVNSIMTERLTPHAWSSQLQRIVEQYYEYHFLFAQSFDSRIDARLSQLLGEIKELNNPHTVKDTSTIYLTLRDDGLDSVNVQYLTTRSTNANMLSPQIVPTLDTSAPAEYAVAEQSLLTPLVQGSDKIGEESQLQTVAKYYFKGIDRIVTKSDIIDFCVHTIQQLYGISDVSVRITRSPITQIAMITIVLPLEVGDKPHIATTLERMLEPRIAGLSQMKVEVL